MEVIKRNGQQEKYSLDKIISAINNASRDSDKNYSYDFIYNLGMQVEDRLVSDFYVDNVTPTVEEIQDTVEEVLIENQLTKVAKNYIVYRDRRRRTRDERKNKNSLLTDEFLSKYKHKPNPFPTELGEFIYYRTYSRWLPKEERREYWWETVKRAVEYNCSLAPTSREEAEKLFDNVYHFRQFLAGRTLWTGGTKASRKYPMSNYNCAFTVINSFKSYEDLFYLLMVGAGVGVRVLPEDVDKLPPVRTNVEVKHEYYEPVEKGSREEVTSFKTNDNEAVIIVGDSKEGWAKAVGLFFEILHSHFYRHITKIYFNYNNVRPKGERLKTFGGHASGHTSIKVMFDKINKILNNKKEEKVKLKPIDCLDIANIIGENVVSGGVRRTSEVGLFNKDDEDILEAKNNLYKQQDGEWKLNEEISHRQMSNNSIMYFEKPSREQLHWQIEQMRYSGEPGFMNAEEAMRRRDNAKGGNPCMEIILDDNGMCNLVSLNAFAFVEDDKLNEEEMMEAQWLNARSAYRMALVEFELPDWDYVNKRDRLIGLSITGWQDMVNALDMSEERQKELLQKLRNVGKQSAKEVAKEYNDNEPVLVTTVKPEGTQTQMPTVSSGLHYNHSPYYIRRVRINADDPLAYTAKEHGWNVKPEVGQDKDNPDTVVIEFPVKAPEGRVKGDVSAIEQLETYKMFMENYVDHNASITVHVRDDEWEEVEEWMWNNWDTVVGISFLSYDDSFYQLMPYEEITEEEYREMVDNMEEFKPYIVNYYEKMSEERELGNIGCETGVCPVR